LLAKDVNKKIWEKICCKRSSEESCHGDENVLMKIFLRFLFDSFLKAFCIDSSIGLNCKSFKELEFQENSLDREK
jgi:hypothetical protein